MLPTLSKSSSRPLLVLACRRGISSKAKFQSAHDKKMEALVSLYHQSNTFITPESLSAVIDQAFTQPLNISDDQRKHALVEFYKMKKDHSESPKFFLGRDDGSSPHSSESMGPGWTESRSRRVDRVYRALMGTQRDGRPSWLALKENGRRVKSQIDEDGAVATWSMEHDAEPLRRGPPVPDYIIIVLSDKNIPVNKIVVHLDTMTVLAKFKTLLTVSLPPDARKVYDDLRAADVPVSDAACRSCPDPCDQDHDDFSRRISIDMESDMLGSVKPYRRQVLVSTGKSDWPKEVTEADGTLAAFLSSANEKFQGIGTKKRAEHAKGGQALLPAGLFTQDITHRLSILNGSHTPLSDDPSQETVIVFPDFKVIADVPRSPVGAETLWRAALDPSYGRLGAESRPDSLRSWLLPYSCAILLCSHKRRDKRCAVVAPILEKTLIHCLEGEGWAVHTGLEDLSGSPTLESLLTEGPEPEVAFEKRLKALGGEHKALILRTSHVGGHKFAGNVIIYNPQGTSVWYGRVTPHDVESIVKNTIINGQVLPAILRGGMNLARPGCKGLYDW